MKIITDTTRLVTGTATKDLFDDVKRVEDHVSKDKEPTEQIRKEIIVGTDEFDHLVGGADDDILVGNGGGDYLEGGEGYDFASYVTADSGVRADLESDGTTVDLIDNDASGDRFDGIEGLIGSGFGDRLYGDDGDNELIGLGGNDELRGRGGVDTLLGGEGDDILQGGTGADHLDGGADFDMADYSDSDEAVVVRLDGGSQGGTAAGDTYVSIEGAIGSDFGDEFFGTDAANAFEGLAGDDRFNADGGADDYDGGADVDTVSYQQSTDAVTVRLDTGHGHGGDAAGDTYRSIENVDGSHAHGNELVGNDDANRLTSFGDWDVVEGGAGDDDLHVFGHFSSVDGGGDDDTITVHGTPGAQIDPLETDAYKTHAVITGGEGEDTLVFSDPAVYEGNMSYVDLFSGTFEFFGYQFDDASVTRPDSRYGFVTGVENVVGSQSHDDMIRGDFRDNELSGRGGRDDLEGLGGNDVLDGGDLQDHLNGGAGDDILTGGADADTFIFDRHFVDNGDLDRVTDFNSLEDVVRFEKMGITSAQEALDHLSQVGDDVVFAYDSAEIVFENTSIEDFTLNSFEIY